MIDFDREKHEERILNAIHVINKDWAMLYNSLDKNNNIYAIYGEQKSESTISQIDSKSNKYFEKYKAEFQYNLKAEIEYGILEFFFLAPKIIHIDYDEIFLDSDLIRTKVNTIVKDDCGEGTLINLASYSCLNWIDTHIIIKTHRKVFWNTLRELPYLIGKVKFAVWLFNSIEDDLKEYNTIQTDANAKKRALIPHQVDTKTDKLKTVLGIHGFFELTKVKKLSESDKQRLIELLNNNGLPYSIAMFEFLGFLKHLENEHFKTKYELNREVARWFNSDKEGRLVKGNISSLSAYSKENKSKYTAHIHKKRVKTDYEELK